MKKQLTVHDLQFIQLEIDDISSQTGKRERSFKNMLNHLGATPVHFFCQKNDDEHFLANYRTHIRFRDMRNGHLVSFRDLMVLKSIADLSHVPTFPEGLWN